jgi:hypothetical protein
MLVLFDKLIFLLDSTKLQKEQLNYIEQFIT